MKTFGIEAGDWQVGAAQSHRRFQREGALGPSNNWYIWLSRTADHPPCGEAKMSNRLPCEDYLIDHLDRLLLPSTLDGTEAHAILEELADAVRDAHGDPIRIRSALLDAGLRLRTLIKDLVPREAVDKRCMHHCGECAVTTARGVLGIDPGLHCH
jgi:hypothetical protein